MSNQLCIGCKRKFRKEESSLLCDGCYEKYKANLLAPKRAGRCPVCGGNVQYNVFYAKIFYAGEKLCSDKCRRIFRIVKHRMEKEREARREKG